jgi:hypothetical protein
MFKTRMVLAISLTLAMAGCTSQAQFLQSMQTNAMQTAVSRGQQ